jgi:hypothetical protein
MLAAWRSGVEAMAGVLTRSTRHFSWRRRVGEALLLALIATFLFPSAAAAAPMSATRVTTTKNARAAVSGPIEGGEGSFFVLLEALEFKEGKGRRVEAVVADAFFGSIECVTLDSDATLRFDGLERVVVGGSVTGECFDLASQQASPYAAEFEVVWRGVGRKERERFEDSFDDQVCVRKVVSRDSVASGTFTWSAPDLGLSGTATSIVPTELTRFSDRCRSAG